MNRRLPSSLALVFALLPCSLALGDDDAKKAPKPDGHVLKTFNMEDWSGGPDGKDGAKKLLKQRFDATFPKGLRVGKEKKELHHYRFESAADVRKMLPIRGEPGVMTGDDQDGLRAAGGLAGQLITAKLNVAFDREGDLGRTKAEDATPLGERVLGPKVPKKLRGLTVRELIAASDKAVAGRYGKDLEPTEKAVDIDDDGKADVSLRALRATLNLVNNSYQKGDEMKKVFADAAPAGVADEDEERDAASEEERGEEDDDEELTEEQEKELERIEAEQEKELDRLEKETRGDYERAVEAGDRRKVQEISERHRQKRHSLDQKFEAKKARLEAKWAEKGREHPGRGKGLRGEHPGRGKGLEKKGGVERDDDDDDDDDGRETRPAKKVKVPKKGKGGGGD